MIFLEAKAPSVVVHLREIIVSGWYKVTVSVFPVEGRLDPKNKRTLKQLKVNRNYWSAKLSKLEFEVVESPAPGAYDLRVGAAPP